MVRAAVARAASDMLRHANRRRRDVAIVPGAFAWLSTEHLKLPSSLSRKLAARFAGPFRVLRAIGPVSF